MNKSDSLSGMDVGAREIAVLVPYDRQSDYLYLDAVGETRAEALSHFTSYMRFDLSLSEIFHMEFAEASLHFGGATVLRSDLIPCVLPRHEDKPFVMGLAPTEDESRRILKLLRQEPSEFSFGAAGIRVTDTFTL